jgi:S1-C subfamily serine protease
MEQKTKKRMGSGTGFAVGVVITLMISAAFMLGAMTDRVVGLPVIDQILPSLNNQSGSNPQMVTSKIFNEESFVEEIAQNAADSVVTVSITTQPKIQSNLFMDPFELFGGRRPQTQAPEAQEQDIGTGFVVDQGQGLVVTNKHVVSQEASSYKVISKDGTEYSVEKIYRDPVNDLGILKISGNVPPALELGDSNSLRVGQFAMAIGTALGEFRHTVTTGVISGLGRGISAGDQFGGFVEELSNVIQTDAAINPGNSGGPLINSLGQVIGVNTAVAQAQNVGFALPINIVKETLSNFNQTGQFDRPFLGVRYRMIDEELAKSNNLPQGAYVVEVVPGSAAAEAGMQMGDIVLELDEVRVGEAQGGLAELINKLKVGQKVTVKINRQGEEVLLEVEMKLGEE